MLKNILRPSLLLFLPVLFFSHAHLLARPPKLTAKSHTTDFILANIQTFYANLGALHSDFVQIFTSARLSREQKESGSFSFRKPSMMRFRYAKPESKDFIYNGRTLWMYYPEDNEVKIRESIARSELGIAFQFLWGSGDLKRSFHVEQIHPCAVRAGKRSISFGRPKDICLALTPRQAQPLFRKLFFAVQPPSYRIREVLYTDTADNCNRFIFSNMKLNPDLPETMFHFKIPPGTEKMILR